MRVINLNHIILDHIAFINYSPPFLKSILVFLAGNRQVDEEDTPRSTNFPQQTVIQICVAVDSAEPAGEEAKPVDDGIARCQIIVREGKVATDYTIALTSTFEKLMTTYAAEVAQCDVDSLKFMSSEGMTVSRTMTPEDLYLEENEVDTFDVFRK
eukprot:m.299337 g.299337  ORF g.299337 m.299337 type:complete len:155 (+) comp20109_c0_seq2:1-465(+)